MFKRTRAFSLVAFALLASACSVADDSNAANDAAQRNAPAAPAGPPAPATPKMRIEVNLTQKQLHVYVDEQMVTHYPVAVGSAEWPTPTGEWTIGQVIFNPRWVPPKDESWAKDEKEAEPGAPDNPLGVVQLVYSPPNSIHGTNKPESIGKAVSHGSIRISNENGVALAKEVMKHGGAPKDEAWVQNALANKTERQEVSLPNAIPIRVIE